MTATLVDTPSKASTGKRRAARLSDSPMLGERRISTNSRIKRDEKYRHDMYLIFVNNALDQKLKGNSEPFDELIGQFNLSQIQTSTSTGLPATQPRLWLSALSHVVSQIERAHSALVDAILAMPWTIMDATFVKTYIAFIGILVSARPEYLSTVLSRTVQGMTHQSGLRELNLNLPESSTSALTRRAVYDRLHMLLQHLLSLIPTLPSTLQPLLVQNFPHKRQNKTAQVTYIRNLLRITQYCVELGDRILSTIIERVIQIDVEIQVELEELESEDSVHDDSVFTLDPFDHVIGDPESESDDSDDEPGVDDLSDLSSDGGEDTPEIATNLTHVQDMVAKLDAILKLIFDHFNDTNGNVVTSPVELSPRTNSPTALTIEEGRQLRRSQFHTLLSIFSRTIIHTFKSRYTQFLVFWYSSLDPEFTDLFQGLLVSKVLFEVDQPDVTRVAAASYISSFVSRAQFVDQESTRRVVGLLCEFLASQLEVLDAEDQEGLQPTIFFAASQAIFLIFCFRWRDLLLNDGVDDLENAEGEAGLRKKWIPELDVIYRAVHSSLNPLKVCSKNVVQQFARVAQATAFLYVYPILESNRRVDYFSTHSSTPSPISQGPSTPVSGRQPQLPVHWRSNLDADLNTFFPFDPYKLPLSSSYIEGVYREWDSVAIEVDDEEEEEDEGDDDDDDGESGDGAEAYAQELKEGGPMVKRTSDTPADDGTETLGESFGGMSISPIGSKVLSRGILA